MPHQQISDETLKRPFKSPPVNDPEARAHKKLKLTENDHVDTAAKEDAMDLDTEDVVQDGTVPGEATGQEMDSFEEKYD